jgi:LPXTG-site transpeptidase (sortase) family protein
VAYNDFGLLAQNANLKAGFSINENIQDGTEEKEESSGEWCIEIPVINLKAQIAEGTSKEVLDEFVGHFEKTQITVGNVGLAAHNRGYEKNYFSDLKKLKEGDLICYQYKNFKKEYTVTKHFIINDEDWTSLEDTEENKLTLITCVENEPKYRRCVQAQEKEE